MLHYILQVVAFQLGFLVIYDAFLRKETFFNWNRAYLLITALLSIVIPFIKIDRIKTIVPEEFVIRLPEVIIGNITETDSVQPNITNLEGITIQPEPISIWNIILFSGMCIATLILVFKILKLVALASKYPKRWYNKLLIVKLINSTSAFSFFHYVFLGDQINPKDQSTILEHEMVHVKQKHTLDLLFFEVLRIVFCFNPLVYMYQNRMATLHEYIADSKAIKQQSKAEYYNNLLAQVFETQQFSFVNPFFKQSLIKKRIVMLSKTKSKQINILKYALLIPLICSMLIYTSSYAQEKQEVTQTEDSKLSHDQLKKKYYNLILEMKESGASFTDIFDFGMSENDQYIKTKTAYYKLNAYFEYISKTVQKRKVENDEDIEPPESIKKMINRTYEEYVAWKHTDEAKEIWENNTRDGVLRLLVNDFNKWSEEEKQEMNHKLEMIERDDYFEKLLVVDMKGKTKMILNNPEPQATIIEVNNKVGEELNQDIEVPFFAVDQVPIMEACKDLATNLDRKDCMSKNIAIHVNKNFNTTMAKSLGLEGKQRVSVIFKINTNGDVVNVKARAPHPDLEKEAIRVIKLLPKFQPGIHKGVPVTVPYSLPILFQVKDDVDSKKSKEEAIKDITEKVRVEVETVETNESKPLTEVPFAIVDNAPKYKGCETIANNDEVKKCTSQGVAEFVNANFNIKLAKDIGLEGKQRISVIFKIDKEGKITGVKARAPHPKLEEEAIRVIKLLPQFIPGTHNGKVVTVPFSLPIVFQVAP